MFNFYVTSNSELRLPDCNFTQSKDSLLKITSTNNPQLLKFSRKYQDIVPSHSEHLVLLHVLSVGLILSLRLGAETKLLRRVNKCLKWLLLLFYLCNIFGGIIGGLWFTANNGWKHFKMPCTPFITHWSDRIQKLIICYMYNFMIAKRSYHKMHTQQLNNIASIVITFIIHSFFVPLPKPRK